MATAQAHYTVPVERSLERVTLELNPEEAQYLVDLLGTVGGVGKFRCINDSITDALRKGTGINYTILTNADEFPFEGGWKAELQVRSA